jgi:hypothetical protein
MNDTVHIEVKVIDGNIFRQSFRFELTIQNIGILIRQPPKHFRNTLESCGGSTTGSTGITPRGTFRLFAGWLKDGMQLLRTRRRSRLPCHWNKTGNERCRCQQSSQYCCGEHHTVVSTRPCANQQEVVIYRVQWSVCGIPKVSVWKIQQAQNVDYIRCQQTIVPCQRHQIFRGRDGCHRVVRMKM